MLEKQAEKERDTLLAEQRQAEYSRQMQAGAALDKQKKLYENTVSREAIEI